MRLPFRFLVVGWALAETLAFVAVVEWLGVGGALLVGIVTSLGGAFLLKRAGASAMTRLRAVLAGRDDGAPSEVLDGSLRALAAALLLLPGFLSDAAGLALALPPVRALVIRRYGTGRLARAGGGPARHGPGAIDLAPEEWSVAPDPRGSDGLARRS